MTTIFVFGSNRQGRHGAGAALYAAQHHGAIYGQARGRQGNSYAVVTKELRADKPPVSVAEIAGGVNALLRYARDHRQLRFKVTPIGCGLAGFRPEQIAPLFADRPRNVILPPEFLEVLYG